MRDIENVRTLRIEMFYVNIAAQCGSTQHTHKLTHAQINTPFCV